MTQERKTMPSPELIRQIADSIRKERGEIEQEKLLEQRRPEEIAREVAELNAEDTEANEMFRKMRKECEDLLSSRGVIKKLDFLHGGLPGGLAKRKVLETSITDDEGEEVQIVLLSKIVPARSPEIRLVVGEVKFPDTELSNSGLVLSLGRNLWYITNELGDKEIPDIKAARKWKEVVDALKNQNQTNQSSPIEHKSSTFYPKNDTIPPSLTREF